MTTELAQLVISLIYLMCVTLIALSGAVVLLFGGNTALRWWCLIMLIATITIFALG